MARGWRLYGAPTVAAVVGGSATAVAWWRLGPVTRGTVWAEDGGVFLRERLALGPGAVLEPYAGYRHLVPRIVVDLAWLLPVERYAVVVSGLACLVVGVVCALVFLLSGDVVRPWPLRVLLAAVPVVLPLAPVEISGTAANLHWYVLVLVPWLYTHRARTWWGAVALAVVTALGVLSEVQATLFLPLLLVAWLPLRRTATGRVDLRPLPVTLAAVVGSGVQVATALTDPRAFRPGDPGASDVLAGYLLQPLGGAWDRRVGVVAETVHAHGWGVAVLPTVLLVVVLVTAVVLGRGRPRWVVAALAGGSLVVWWAALVANGSAVQDWVALGPAALAAGPQRYAAASGLLLVSGAVVAASVVIGSVGVPGGAGRPGAGRSGPTVGRSAAAGRLVAVVLAWCVVAAVVVAAVWNAAPGTTRRSAGPVWSAQVPAAAEACRADPTLPSVVLRTAPWRAAVPCDRLVERP